MSDIDVYYSCASGRHNIDCVALFLTFCTEQFCLHFMFEESEVRRGWLYNEWRYPCALSFTVHSDPRGYLDPGMVQTNPMLLSSHQLHLLLSRKECLWVTIYALKELGSNWNPVEKDQRWNEKLKKVITGDFLRWGVDKQNKTNSTRDLLG